MKFEKISIKKSFNLLLAFLIIAPTIILSFGAATHYALAIEPVKFSPSIGIPGSTFQSTTTVTMTASSTIYIAQYISAFYDYAMGIVGIVAVIVLMIGGIIWLTSGGNPTKIEQAKDLILGSITGVGLLLGSWILLNTVDPNLVKFKINNVKYIDEVETKYCCGRLKGSVPAEVIKSDKQIIYKCPTDSSECKDTEECTQTEDVITGTKTKPYSCRKKGGFTCCEYDHGIILGGKTCDTQENPTGCSGATKAYPGHVCDPDGGGDWDCYAGGRQCCQHKYNRVPFTNTYLDVACIDNYTTRECYHDFAGDYSWVELFPLPASCQSSGYCN